MLKRLRPSIRKRIAHLMWPGGYGIVRRDGVLYLLNLKSVWDKHILQWGGYELERQAFLIENIQRPRCDIFLDIGANLGVYAVSVALKTDCKTIIAYDADERNCDRIRAQLLINDLTNRVQTRIAAITDHSGTVSLVRASVHDSYNSHVRDDANGPAVPAVRLDDELPIAGQRVALKIDIEGHELVAPEKCGRGGK
jgi:FkbM family methyltransferase